MQISITVSSSRVQSIRSLSGTGWSEIRSISAMQTSRMIELQAIPTHHPSPTQVKCSERWNTSIILLTFSAALDILALRNQGNNNKGEEEIGAHRIYLEVFIFSLLFSFCASMANLIRYKFQITKMEKMTLVSTALGFFSLMLILLPPGFRWVLYIAYAFLSFLAFQNTWQALVRWLRRRLQSPGIPTASSIV